MKKCTSCNQRPLSRYCPALEANICSFCCGTKRLKEINCIPDCEYLKKGEEYRKIRQINKEISDTFQPKADDIFINSEDAVNFAMRLESFFISNFYDDMSINDNDIYKALSKIYLYQTNNNESLNPGNKCEELIFEAFKDFDEDLSEINIEIKAKTILRILRSIKTVSGGALGNRNYLELIHSQFTGTGKWSELLNDE